MKIRNVDILYSSAHPGQEEFWIRAAKGEWEPETLDILDKYIVRRKTFIDIGAWNGILSLYAAKLGATVESVECDPIAAGMILANMELNRESIFLSTCAISDHDGTAVLESHNGDWGNSMSTIVDRKEQKGQKEVQTLALESFIKMRGIDISDVCLIKIDTEGAECLIIPSSKEFLSVHKPTILLSLHSFWFPEFEKNVQEISDTIFSIYNVVPVYTYNEEVILKEHTVETFKEEMLRYRCCDVLLLPK